jgi:pyruvate dehydrogenase E1 component
MTPPATTVLPDVSKAVISADRLATLESIQRRILWLTTNIIHHANHVRPNLDGTKVGGHQASSASTISILTALYFHFLQPGDRVSIKPHASPAFHAIQYLLGRLPQQYLTELRAYKGLQSYPSRTKDPDGVDFSTGSVGLGAVAPAFAALAHRYAKAHFQDVTSRRFIALIGDAELDEGNVWEALLDDALENLENLIWIVDLNRQSLDRVIPGIRAARLKRLFAEHGWRVLETKYGRRLQALFARPGGEALRERIDTMSNEEYQALIRMPGPALRERLLDCPAGSTIAAVIADLSDDQLGPTVSNLGGHDLEELIDTLAKTEQGPPQPTVIFAYTIKGWGLPIAGHPLNHSQLLSADQIAQLRQQFGIASEWEHFPEGSAEAAACREAAVRIFGGADPKQRPPATSIDPTSIPSRVDLSVPESTSTQDTFGRLLLRFADIPGLRERIVTTSPDVSVSTNLAGWINKTGVFSPIEHPDYETEAYRLLRWKRGPSGQHVELGISEMNLFMLLGMFGIADDLCGQQLIPIGTVYDPFVLRGLDALIYGVYSGARFIFAGTPSGITLSPEGGAHQSTITPSLAIELPRLEAFEPCFGRELEWQLLDALRMCCDRNGRPSYFRLTTRPIDQRLLTPALNRLGEAELQRQVLRGGYRLIDSRIDHPSAPVEATIQLVTAGAIVPEVCAAAEILRREGVAANVINLVSARRLYEAWRAGENLSWILPDAERRAPIVSILDGASHALAWLGSVAGAPTTALGVDDFGLSAARADLYHHFGLDPQSIAEAAFAILDRHPA